MKVQLDPIYARTLPSRTNYSPRSPRPKVSRLRPNDDRHDEKHFQTIIYHNSGVEPLFYDDEKHGKLLLLLHAFFLINIYGAKVITSVLMDNWKIKRD